MIAANVAGATTTTVSVAAAAEPSIDDVVPAAPHRLMDSAHFLSAGMVSFARGLNDTPKMAALLLMVPWLTPAVDIALVGSVIAIGGVLAARRVAETMSLKITSIDHSQGFVANLTTSALVLAASPLGLPVATTHVAACSLFGIGLVTGQANTKTILGIIAAWLVTVPFAGAAASVVYYGVSNAFG
jgi:PiT family inorganic phosphate transporter